MGGELKTLTNYAEECSSQLFELGNKYSVDKSTKTEYWIKRIEIIKGSMVSVRTNSIKECINAINETMEVFDKKSERGEIFACNLIKSKLMSIE